MNKNMGTLDRVVRIVLAAAVIVLFSIGRISGAAAVVLIVLAIALLATGLIGTCPLYMVFKKNTRIEKKE